MTAPSPFSHPSNVSAVCSTLHHMSSKLSVVRLGEMLHFTFNTSYKERIRFIRFRCYNVTRTKKLLMSLERIFVVEWSCLGKNETYRRGIDYLSEKWLLSAFQKNHLRTCGLGSTCVFTENWSYENTWELSFISLGKGSQPQPSLRLTVAYWERGNIQRGVDTSKGGFLSATCEQYSLCL